MIERIGSDIMVRASLGFYLFTPFFNHFNKKRLGLRELKNDQARFTQHVEARYYE